jgi:hypothetical protein
VFHSPSYRSRYAEFLKIDFPRLPLTSSLDLFRALARLGGELVALHLLESPKLEKPITRFIGPASPVVEKVSFVGRVPSHGGLGPKPPPAEGSGPTTGTVWLDKAQTTGFKGVPDPVWNFHIGGYQVCEKWLKDRKGRALVKDDIAHYHKIVIALSETIRLMGLSVYSSAKGCWISRGMARMSSGGSGRGASFSGFSGFSSFLSERAAKS